MRRSLCILLLLFAASGFAGAGETPKAELERIMSRPEYRRWQGSLADMRGQDRASTASWLDSLFDWLREWYNRPREKSAPAREPRYPEPARGEGGGASGAFTVFGYALLAAMALFLVYSLHQWWRGRSAAPTAKSRRCGGDMAKALKDGEALAFDGDAWVGEAERRLAEGELREAYRALYLGLLSGLHDRGRIVFARNRTNWHYVNSFRGEASERREFSDLTGIFDAVWYGWSTAMLKGDVREVSVRVAALLGEGARHE